MPQSLAKIVVHIIFNTKNRTPWLKTPEIRDALHGYVIGTLRNLDSPSIIVNSVADHLHILCQLSRKHAVAVILEEVKKSSSQWIKTVDPSLHDFYWQNGYGAFSVSESQIARVREYIAKQEEHHRKLSFQDEFRAFLRKHGISYDERYVWD